MARTPNTTKEETHDRIVAVAARALRRHGYEGTGVAAVMQEAGLTHGGFYAHFPSREALLVAAMNQADLESRSYVARAIEQAKSRGTSPFRALVEVYLSEEQLGRLDAGCPIAALGCEVPRQAKAVRKASVDGVAELIQGVRRALPAHSHGLAPTIAGALVGALQLARAFGDNAEGRAHLASVRKTLLQQFDHKH